MKVHWWSYLLGIVCMPAEVILSTWKVSSHMSSGVSQDPLSTSQVRINSSIEIRCSTSLSGPMGVYLYRGFHGNKQVVFLNMEKGQVTKRNIAAEFEGRILITQEQQIKEGHGFTFQLSLLGLEDTDWYYCSWIYFRLKTMDKMILSSNDTIIIVRERDPKERCKTNIEDLIFITLSVTAFIVTLLLFIGALTIRCKRFKKHLRPAKNCNTMQT